MNFEIKNSKQLKNNIIDISAINISDIIHNIFLTQITPFILPNKTNILERLTRLL